MDAVPLEGTQRVQGWGFVGLSRRVDMVNHFPARGQISGNNVIQKMWQNMYGSLHALQFICGTAFFF